MPSRARALALVAAALLVALALAGCGRHQATATPTAPQPSYGVSFAAGPTGSFDPGASLSPSVSPSGTAESSAGQAGPPTPDPAASELDQINQLINDINSSIESSSSQGGE